jgi:hypothetical protein
MSIMSDATDAVHNDPLMLSYYAVKEGRASWRHRKPIDEAVAVAMGEAEWVSKGDVTQTKVRCPRCLGRGILEFARPDGPLREICTSCGGDGWVDPAVAETIRGLMEEAGRARIEREAVEPSGPYREDLDDFCPTAAEDEWNALRASEVEFRTFLHDQSDRLRYVETSPHAEWLAVQIDRMASLARTLDAKDGAEFDDRLATLDRDYC